MIKKFILTFFLVFNLFLTCAVFGQAVGDYRSVASGNWATAGSWQICTSVSPITWTTATNYPGQIAGTGAVLIQTGHIISISSTITTLSFGTLTITGRLNLNGDNSPGGMDFNLTTQSIIVTPSSPSGFIGFDNKVNLRLPSTAGLQVSSGGLDDTNPCTANQIIYIGINAYAKCTGGGALPDFGDIMTNGGTLNAIATSNSPVCQFNIINLIGNYTGVAGTTTSGGTPGVNYSWSVQAPDESIISVNTKDNNFTANQTGIYTATLNCSTFFGTALFTNSKTISVVVNALPIAGLTSNDADNIFCAGTSVTFTATGGTNYSFRVAGTSVQNGATATYTTTALTTGQVVDVIVTNASGCSATSSGINNAVSAPPSAPSVYTTQPTCADPTATITITAVVGETYSFDGSAYSSTLVYSGLAQGSSHTIYANNAAGCISLVTNVVINTTDKIWNGAWSPSAPTSADNIVFTGSGVFNSTGNLTACSCQVTGNVTVNINSGHTLTLTNQLDVTSFGSITFHNNASLVQINNVSNSGDIDYVRTTNTVVRSTDYTYWSSPVSPQTIGNFSPYTPDGMMYSYNSNIEDWTREYLSTSMNTGIGYIVRGPEPPGPPPPPSQFTATFTGEPNNGDVTVPVTFTNPLNLLPTDPNFGVSYLLGNPYPSAIDADTFLSDNTNFLEGTIYFWTHNTALDLAGNITNPGPEWAYAYSLDDYASYNTTGGVGIGNFVNGIEQTANRPNGYIAAGQGFFATAKATGTVTFNNNMRVAGNNTQFFKKRNSKTEKVIEKNRVWLNLTNTQGAFKQTLVGYITNATNDYDSRFDGESFDGNEFVDFYSVNQEKNLVIQGRALPFDENDEVPLGYRTTIKGAFSINIDQADGLLDNQAVFIEDKLTNTITDLKSGNYTFNTVAGTFNDRFVLRYKNNSTAKTLAAAKFDALENTVLVSSKNKQIKINSFTETIEKVTIYDLQGRQIYQKDKVNSSEFSIANLVSSRQVLLVKTVLQNGVTVTDKIIY